MKPLEVWTCQRAENLKKKSSKIPKNNYAATMVLAAGRQIIGGGGRSTKAGGGPPKLSGARPAHGSNFMSTACGRGEGVPPGGPCGQREGSADFLWTS